MKTLGAIATFILFLCVTLAMPAYAQDRDESRPGQPQERKEEKTKDKDKDKREDKAAKPGEPRQQPGTNQEERHNQPEAARPQETRPQEERKEQREQRPEQRMQQGNQQRPAHAQQGKRIPDDKFRASFGRQHTFHVQRTQIINNPQPVVVYGGYSFQLIDPWPAEWAYDDDCYIDYIDGEYFLFNALHPGIRITVFVVG